MHTPLESIVGINSVLRDFVDSGFDPSHLGRTSEPHMFTVEQGAVNRVIWASGVGADWQQEPGRVGIAPHAYFFYLLNNTPTYRAYEQWVVGGVPEGMSHLHTGDEFHYYAPMRVGDTLAVTTTISRLERKQGRNGPLVMIEDEWKVTNQRNERIGSVVRKVATVEFAVRDKAPIYRIADVPVDRLGVSRPDSGVRHGDLKNLQLGEITHAFDHGAINWLRMMSWLAAVDEYSPTHYDPDYALSHGYPDGKSIVAGPQMAAWLLAPVVTLFSDAWHVRHYRNRQLREVFPNERLYSYGRIAGRRNTAKGTEVDLELWLMDEKSQIRGDATAILVERAW